MKIRRLEIQGFKSFADRTTFEFGDGISSIVGPNGCGKSNVVDALKWVLGDMSPRSLRGKRMEDVIFAGSRHRRPVGMAEVTLVLDNSSGLLRTERTEVSIGRRLYRDGQAEYYLGGDRARLKDIRELFLDTGLGVEGNAIMEQGQIDALLAANPQDRRGIFEEAAGVSRYKQRRKEADQRLRRTDDNLERLLDVLELEEKRLRSLKNQAGRARRYQQLREELGRKRVLRGVVHYRAVAADRSDLQERMEKALRREREAAQELATLEEASREADQARERALEAVHAQETRIAQAAADARSATEKAEYATRSREELTSRIAAARGQAQQARTRVEELGREQAQLDRDARAAGEQALEQAAALEGAEVECRRLDAEVGRLRGRLEEAKREVLDLLGRTSDARNREAHHLAAVRQAQERAVRLGVQQRHLEQRHEGVEAEVLDLIARAEQTRAEERERALRLQRAEERRGLLAARLREARARKATASEERATLAARLDVLERLAAAGEGLAEGARAVLDAVESGGAEGLGGVLGVLADLVLAEPERAAVLDRLLGPAAGALVTRTTADALGWIQWLRENHENARARFLCLDLVRDEAPVLPDEIGALGCEPHLRSLVASVATGTLLVQDLETGLELWRQQGTNSVTPTGDRVTASGALLGGADGQGLGLVERSAEMQSLRDGRATLDGVLRRLREDVQAAEDALQRSDEEIAILRAELGRHAEDRSRGGEALVRAEKERGHLVQSLDVVRSELEECSQALFFEHEAAAVLGRRIGTWETDRSLLERAAEETARKHQLIEAERTEAREHLVEIRLALAEARATQNAALGRLERTGDEIRAQNERSTRLDEEARELTERLAVAEVEITEATARARRREEERRRAGDALVVAREHHEELTQAAGQGEVRRREVQGLHEDLRGRLENFRLKDSEMRVRMESLIERVRQDHGLELKDVDRETAPTEEVDVDAVEQEVEELRRRMETLGNVNLNAITELEEVQEHVDFLRGQQKDLLDAKADLERVIGELDEVTRKRFAQTFETVREHFRETFRRLFGGGRADVVLEDASNPLESGVDIVARPPGKEQRTISLLSGGERTLTAVALLFAVFKAKPSPFAILDEVDAALDEANVRRLIGLVREFTDRSQFLMVTHAKTTMEAADLLYGVTMEEPGVSKQVAVRLTEYPAEVAAAG